MNVSNLMFSVILFGREGTLNISLNSQLEHIEVKETIRYLVQVHCLPSHQGSAKYGGFCHDWFVNKALLEHSPTHSYIVCACFHASVLV